MPVGSLPTDATPMQVTSRKIEIYSEKLEKAYQGKSDIWSSQMSKHQQAAENLNKFERRADQQRRQQGQTPYNADGSMSFLGGFTQESHLRQPLEIIRDLQRYALNDMLKLRQGRVEAYLLELVEALNFDLLIGRHPEGSKEHFHLRQNVWATQNVLSALNNRIGIPITKADVVRKLVSELLY